MREANDAIHFDMTITLRERRCVFRFAHTELSQSGNKWGNRRNASRSSDAGSVRRRRTPY